MKTILLTLIISSFCFHVKAQQTNNEINHIIDSVRIKHGIPAMVVAVIKTDTCYYGIGGISKLNGTDTLTLKSKFHLGSNTKAITSFIAMKMIENHQIKLETKLVELIPELSNINNVYKNTTLGDLLSHNAKIQPYTGGVEYEKLPEIKGTISEKRMQFSEFVLNEQEVEKGTYSNAGYTIAALMLEKALNKSFEELVKKTMNDLELKYFIGFPNKEDIKNPWGHWKENNKLVPLSPGHSYKLQDYIISAGDISMNIVDYSKFIQLNLQGLLSEDNFLKSDNYKMLHFGLNGYSYGWGNTEIDTNKISYHDGSAGTYYCHTIIIPYKKIAIVVMANSAEDKQVAGMYKLRELMIGKYGS